MIVERSDLFDLVQAVCTTMFPRSARTGSVERRQFEIRKDDWRWKLLTQNTDAVDFIILQILWCAEGYDPRTKSLEVVDLVDDQDIISGVAEFWEDLR